MDEAQFGLLLGGAVMALIAVVVIYAKGMSERSDPNPRLKQSASDSGDDSYFDLTPLDSGSQFEAGHHADHGHSVDCHVDAGHSSWGCDAGSGHH
jgi:hypothetical protein